MKTISTHPAHIALALAWLALGLSTVPSALAGNWITGSPMDNRLYFHSATLLTDGTVLAAGGIGGASGFDSLASAEVYQPATGTWTSTGSLNTARRSHGVGLLLNGKVLIVGGDAVNLSSNSMLASAEVYDPATRIWTPTGSMAHRRIGHTTTVLPNGKVLASGGQESGAGLATSTAELYDPASGTWMPTGSMNTPRSGHSATLLPSGKVLVVSGNSAELFDPAAGTWTGTGAPIFNRSGHFATLLTSGKVLVAGGYGDCCNLTATAELYDPISGTWSATGSLIAPRTGYSIALLQNGKVLLTGGSNFSQPLTDAYLYDPITGTWASTVSMNVRREGHQTTLLPDGSVLATGGNPNSSIFSVERLRRLVAGDATYLRAPDVSLRITLSQLFTNITFGGGARLIALGAGSPGTTIVTNSTSILYHALTNVNDSFTYTVTDGIGTSTATILVYLVKVFGPPVPMSSIKLTGSTATIRAFGLPGYTYALETATNLAGPWWPVHIAEAGLTNGLMVFTDNQATNTQRFYRLAQP